TTTAPPARTATAPPARSATTPPARTGRTVIGADRASRRTSTPAAFMPMLATAGTARDLDADEHWAFELKWDGIRAIATVSGDTVSFVSRNGIDLTPSYPELSAIADRVRGDAVLDGEIVAMNARGLPDFGLLQTRMNAATARDIEAGRRTAPVQFVAFDLLETAGRSLLAEPYDERRRQLTTVTDGGGVLQIPDAIDGDIADAVAASRDLGLEGVMAKRVDAEYSAGSRSRAWIKIKHYSTQEVVIGGWRPGRGNREGKIGSLLMGVHTPSGLQYVGRVGTGFSDRDLDAFARRFARLGRATTPFVDVPSADASDAHWLTPSLVGEVEFAEWTNTGRLRQPSWRGWRPDKVAGDVTAEVP
ncbi:non-homologous end-joining DNA ligase, partial [Marisediminicola senii]|uniref:non-homologous end-joining DNA ligase n=1 Tax=Marisediminicola senii TaxID=2711233 RepID=UPI001911A08C